MKAIQYIYSVLQYRHSQTLGEVLNIGVLVYVPSIKRLYFIYPEKLIRLRFTYPNLSEKTIKAYLKSFAEKIHSLNERSELFIDYGLDKSLNFFAETELIPQDASTLQFTDSRKGLEFANNVDTLIRDLYNSYLLAFAESIGHTNQLNEDALLSKYKGLLKEFDKGHKSEIVKTSNRIYYDYTIDVDEQKHFKFDIAWQNGSLNLVKPISFDVIKADTIINKAYRYFGQFTDLEKYATTHNYRFDLLIAKPQDKHLYKAYDTALELLYKPDRVNIVLDKDLPDYTKKTYEAIYSDDN